MFTFEGQFLSLLLIFILYNVYYYILLYLFINILSQILWLFFRFSFFSNIYVIYNNTGLYIYGIYIFCVVTCLLAYLLILYI